MKTRYKILIIIGILLLLFYPTSMHICTSSEINQGAISQTSPNILTILSLVRWKNEIALADVNEDGELLGVITFGEICKEKMDCNVGFGGLERCGN